MSLEHFKKQVLLLHSEQSTLDNLSSGFNDRYTVHCATSGTEALNTLGETVIDVIITAHDLPGMSGLDALREAKKRSPETIGILLAGNEDDGLEALVGDQEVFQIVRGGVTPDTLKELIDNATRQARLMALAESANDTAANVDEPVTEHIVMETSEHGATIISDGTGQVPVLDPQKISAADVGARGVDVLVVTQDEEFMSTVRESARGLHNVTHANTLAQAEDAVSNSKVGVAVVDAAMVGANVEKLTMHLRSKSPRLVAIVAGRRDDGEMLMDLINRGRVYRFLLKPVSPGRSRLAIEASVKHHLEAPDSAFKVAGQAAPPPKAAPKPQPKPQPKPEAKAKPKPAAKPQPPAQPKPAPASKAESVKKKPQQAPAPVKKPPAADKKPAKAKAKAAASSTIIPDRQQALSPMDDGLDAFGGDDSSFTETMTGIINSVTESFSKKRKEKPVAETPVKETPVAEKIPEPANAGSGGSLLQNPTLLGAGAVVLVAVIGLSLWLFGGSDEAPVSDQPAISEEPVATTPAATEAETVAEPVIGTEIVAPAGPDIDAFIEEAQLAASAGQVYNPPGSNAIEIYMAGIEAAPENLVLLAGLEDMINQALAMAETAILENRTLEAAAALERVRQAQPDNPRLPFLNAQLAQAQLRFNLDEARAAIREQRFEDASSAIATARSLPVSDSTEIDVVADELSAALSQQRVEDVLAQANTRLEEGRLIAPSNDNARYYYELALSTDPGNTAAQQGLSVVASKLVLRAREQIDAGEFEAAEALLADARRLDPASSELSASTAALKAARERRAREIREAEERAEAERLAAERAAAERAAAERAAAERAAAEKAAAERAAAEKLAAEKAAAEKAAAERAAAEKLAAENLTAAAPAPAQPRPQQAAAQAPAQQPVRSSVPDNTGATQDSLVAAAGASGGTSSPPMQRAAATPAPAQAGSSLAPEMISITKLERTKYVAPKYPRAAQRRNVSGWVDVVFVVDIDGTVANVSVRDSAPGDTFVNSAIKAVEAWRFEPVIENGVAVQRRSAIRMMFALE